MKRTAVIWIFIIGFMFPCYGFTCDFEDKTLDTSTYPAHSIMEAVYDCTVKGQIVEGKVKYRIKIWEENSVTIPLLSEYIAINKTDLPKDVLLVINKGWYCLIFPKKGEYNVAIDFIVRLKKIEDRNIFAFSPPNAVVSKLNLLIPGTGLDMEINPSLSVETKEIHNKSTLLTAFLGTTKDIQVSWSAKPSVAKGIKPMFTANNTTILSISPGIIKTTSIINYKIMQGKVSNLKIDLPSENNLLAVRGNSIENWDLKKAEHQQVLEVKLSQEITDNYELTIEMEKTTDENSVTYMLTPVSTIGAERESGNIVIVAKENLKIQPVKRSGISQIDVNELPEEAQKTSQQNACLAYRYLKQPITLDLMIEKIKPDVTARNNIFVHIDEDLIKLNLFVNYDIRKIGVFDFNIHLPKDFALIDVEGNGIEDWNLIKKDEYHELEVRLKNKVQGEYQLALKLEKPINGIPPNIEIPKIIINNVKREIGYIGISSASNIKLTTQNRENISEIDINELINETNSKHIPTSLAYKYITHPYELSLAAEEVAPRVTAEVFTFLSVGEGLLLIDSAITYNILYTGIDEFTVALPEDIQVVGITGNNIKSKEEFTQEQIVNGKTIKEKIYRVRLHSKVKGTYNLYYSYEKPLIETSGKIVLPKLRTLDIQREIGYYCIGPRTNAEITPANTNGATLIDINELPKDKTAGIDIPLVLSFKYVKHPYNITIDVKKHEDISVLVAIAESSRINTILTSEGQIIVNALYNIKNKQKQYLTITLPEDANIWSAFVNNKPVKPSKTQDGHILIPLEKLGNETSLFPVELIYETKHPKLNIFGRLKMIQPKLDIPLTNVTWNLYLPEGYKYRGFGGNLNLVNLKTTPQITRSSSSNVNIEYRANNQETKNLLNEKANKLKQDNDFLTNIEMQVTRYEEFAKRPSDTSNTSQKGVTHGKVVGALPIRINIPNTGKLFTFNKTFSSNELLSIHAIYNKNLPAGFFWLGIITILSGALTLILKYRTTKLQPEVITDNSAE